MNIDWFTFSVQIVNFLILVGLLRWFLYGPIVRAMQNREAKIAERFHEAQQREEAADQRAARYQEQLDQLESQREKLLKEAREDAQQEYHRRLDEARQSVEQQQQSWEASYQRAREARHRLLRRTTGQLGLAAARRAVAELAGDDLEAKMYDRFIEQLQQLDAKQREEISLHLNNDDAPLVVRSGFPLNQAQETGLQQLVRKQFGEAPTVHFEHDHELVCGLELDLGSYRFGWNVEAFFQELERAFEERLRTI